MAKEKYQLYELFNFADGNDDMLSDIGSGEEVRQGMWAQIPYSVSDGQGAINEEFVHFVSNRDYYPNKALTTMPYLMEYFNNCIGNLKEAFKLAKEPRRFYENLLKLQEYLIKQNSYSGEPLALHETNEVPRQKKRPEIPQPEGTPSVLLSWGNLSQEYSQNMVNAIAQKLQLGQPKLMGGAGFGYAYDIGDGKVLKITSDISEADSGFKIMRNHPKTLAEVYAIYKVVDTEKNMAFYVLIEEHIHDKPMEKFRRFEQVMDTIKPNDMTLSDFFKRIKIPQRFNYDEMAEIAKQVLTANPEANINEQERKELYNYLIGLLNIRKDLIDYSIGSTDYITIGNLGYKNGILTYFDVGGYIAEEPQIDKNDIIYLPEGQDDLSEDYDRNIADRIANQVATKLNLNLVPMKGGNFGMAYDIGNDRVLKITKDNSEAAENLMLIGKPLKYIAQPYNVYEIKPKSDDSIPKTWAIVLEKLRTDEANFKRLKERMDFVFEKIMGVRFADVVDYYLDNGEFGGDVDKTKVEKYMSRNPEDAKYFYGVLKIAEECKQYGIESMDYLNYTNLGYKKSGALGFFDVGFGNGFLQPQNLKKIEVDEDGSAKFSTTNSVGQDDFPTYETNDTSQSIENDLNANSAMYNEDLEYNHVSDATKDEYELTEGKLKPITGKNDRNAYFMSVEDDVFIHFAPKKEAVQIAKSKKLDPSFSDTFVDAVFAVSLTYGEFYPSVQIHNIGGKRSRDFNDYVAIVFKTSDKPKVGYSTEVVWNGIVNLQIIKYLTVNGAINLLKNVQYKIGENDYVLYREELIQYVREDRIKSFGAGSQSVSVKKKCELGGQGNTSAACNQGDINNLDIKPLDENVVPNRDFSAWITPDNKIIEVIGEGHFGYIKTIYTQADDPYYEAIDDGWVRVHYGKNEHELSMEGLNKKRIKNVIKEVFYSLVKSGNVDIYIDYKEGNMDIIIPDDEDGKSKLVDLMFEENNINETGEGNVQPYQLSIIKSTDRQKIYSFTTEDNDVYSVEFDLFDDGEDRWKVVFGIDDDKRVDNYVEVVNKGRLYRIMATMIKLTRGFLINTKPQMLSIEPTSKNDDREVNQRFLLYSRFIQKHLPIEYEILHQNQDEITIKRKDGSINENLDEAKKLM